VATTPARSLFEKAIGWTCVVVQIANLVVWVCVFARFTERVGIAASPAGAARAASHPRRPP
jgi:hypothetical protein